jgi:arylsulfatase A-like enzyme
VGDEDPGSRRRHVERDRLPAAWIDGDYKLHRPTGALHNIAKDPAEKVNLAASEPERVTRMQSQLEAWQKSVVRSLNGQDYS